MDKVAFLTLTILLQLNKIHKLETEHDGVVEYYLNIFGVLKNNTSWADQDHVVTREQFPFQVFFDKELSMKTTKETPSVVTESLPPLEIEDDQDMIKVSNSFMTVCISKADGSIISLCYDGKEMLGKKGLQPSYHSCHD